MDLTPEQLAIINDNSRSKSDRFRKLYETGLNPYQIAKAMNTYDSFVRSALARTHSLPAREGPTKADLFRQDHDNGLTISEIAKKHNAYYSHVYQVITAYRSQKEKTNFSVERPETYLFLDGHVASLMELTNEHRAYVDNCIEAFRQPVAAQEFEKLVFGKQNPVLIQPSDPSCPFGVVTREAYNTTLFQVLRDMLFRLEIREHSVASSHGDMSEVDPFLDKWIPPTEAATILGISLTAIHKAIESGRLIAKAAIEGGIHRVISMNSVRVLHEGRI